MLNEYIKCIPCKGYTKGCKDYTPYSILGEESPSCSHYINLVREVNKRTSEEKKQLKGDLEKLFEGKVEGNKERHSRYIEDSDKFALRLA